MGARSQRTWRGAPWSAAAGVLRLAGPGDGALALTVPGTGSLQPYSTWAPASWCSRRGPPRMGAGHQHVAGSLPGRGQAVLLPDGRIGTFANGTLADPATTPTTPLTEPGRAARLLVGHRARARGRARPGRETAGARASGASHSRSLLAPPTRRSSHARCSTGRPPRHPMHALDGALLVLTRGRPGLTALLPAPDGCSRRGRRPCGPRGCPGQPRRGPGRRGAGARRGRWVRPRSGGARPLPPLEPLAEGPVEAPFAPALEALASPSPAARGLALERLLGSGGQPRGAPARHRPSAASGRGPPLWSLARCGPPAAGCVEQLLHRDGRPCAARRSRHCSPRAPRPRQRSFLACADDEAWIRALAAAGPLLGWPGGLAALDGSWHAGTRPTHWSPLPSAAPRSRPRASTRAGGAPSRRRRPRGLGPCGKALAEVGAPTDPGPLEARLRSPTAPPSLSGPASS